MSNYTVEAVTAAVENDDWSKHRRVLDLVPGTVLLEDPIEPRLIFPVTADTQGRAFLFVDGIFKLVGIEPVSGTVELDEDEDDFYVAFDDTDEPWVETEVGGAAKGVRDWVDGVPPSPICV